MKVITRTWCIVVAAIAPFSIPAIADDNALEKGLDEAFEAGQLSGLHSVLIFHRGEAFGERHYNGTDETIGRAFGVIESTPGRLHDLRSITKSITSLLYGIALSEEIVPGLDDKLVAQFPQYPDLANDPLRQKILIRHVLSMTLGTQWNENVPYTSPRNSEIAMEMAADRYRFVLDRDMVEEPGAKWNYNGGATAVIAHLIAKGAGKSIDEYAKEKLFDPMGIEDFSWARGGDNEPMAASGLRLSIHDLAKFGMLILDGGKWQGQQLVPARWLDVSTTAHVDLPFGLRYGYFWWLAAKSSTTQWAAGFGNGGQRLHIDRANELLIVIFAGNYNQPDQTVLPTKVMTEFVYPAIRAKQ
jgi:CubicO group peptidase (beta-lactamase class C family)